jgi:hypothetical protein
MKPFVAFVLVVDCRRRRGFPDRPPPLPTAVDESDGWSKQGSPRRQETKIVDAIWIMVAIVFLVTSAMLVGGIAGLRGEE